jgi:hypothetical protein
MPRHCSTNLADYLRIRVYPSVSASHGPRPLQGGFQPSGSSMSAFNADSTAAPSAADTAARWPGRQYLTHSCRDDGRDRSASSVSRAMWPGLGDCLLAYFGCPRAREDKVEGRCLALELVEAIALLEAHPECGGRRARRRGRCSAAPFSVHCAASNDRVRAYQ